MATSPEKTAALKSLRIDPAFREPESQNGIRLRHVVVISCLLSFGLIGWFLFNQRAPQVEVAQVILMNRKVVDNSVLAASGYVEARRQATVSSKITGQVTGLFVEEGMKVEMDQVLATLDDAEAQAQLQSALVQVAVAKATVSELKVRLAEANRTCDRAQLLLERSVISQEEFDKAQTERDSLQASLLLFQQQMELADAGVMIAQRHLDNYTIRAPFSGIAISKDAQIGEMISPVSAGGGFTRTGISTIVDMTSLEIEVDVNEAYIARVQPGQKVIAVLDAYPDWQVPASVRTIIPSADRQKATVKVRIKFDQLDPRILPDMGVKVSFLPQEIVSETTEAESKPMLIVDTGAVHREGDQSFVFVCREDNSLEYRNIEVGTTLPKGVEIIKGLTQGEWVVTSNGASLKAGMTVRRKL